MNLHVAILRSLASANKMKLSVVIPTYRRADSLGRTLGTIIGQNRRPEEVIIVDQSPPAERPAVLAMIQQASLRGLSVRMICSDIQSSTRSRNIGLEVATGDWVIFSDDDVDWPSGLSDALIAKVEAEPALTMVAARDTCVPQVARPAWQRFLAAIFSLDSWTPLRRGRVFACMQARYPQPIVGDMETEFATGYWFAVDREFLAANLLKFDEKMSRYAQAEDMLFSHQVYEASKKTGRRCVVSEDIHVAHLVSQEWREADSFADLCSAWNRIYIASTLRPGIRFWLSMAAIYWAAIHQALVRAVRGRGWVGHLRAYLVALRHLGEIRSGRFNELYALYEKPNVR